MDRTVKKNLIMSVILTGSGFVFPLVTYSYAARVLGAEGTGRIAFAQSIIQYFLYLAVLGIPAYGLRECAKVRDDKEKLSQVARELVMISLISAAATYLLFASVLLVVPKLFGHRRLLLVMSVNIFLNAVGLEWLYQALEKYAYITVRTILFRSVAVILTFAFVKSPDDEVLYALFTILIAVANNLCNFVGARKYISLKRRTSYEIKRHIKPVLTLFSAAAVITIYTNIDVSMLGFLRSEQEVGLYNAAVGIKSVMLSALTAVTSVLVPRIAHSLRQGDTRELKGLILSSLRLSMMLVLPPAGFVFLFADGVLRLVCGEGFSGAVVPLRILMVCMLPLIFTNLFGNLLLIPMGKEKLYSRSVVVGLFINVTLNGFLIPTWGAAGAAIAILATELWNMFRMGSECMQNFKWDKGAIET